MSITTKLGSLIIDVGSNTKWIKFTSKNKACNKWGLREIIKERTPENKLSNVTYIFSTNPLLGYQRVTGSPDKMCKLWRSVTNLDNKEAVSDLLNFLEKIGWSTNRHF